MSRLFLCCSILVLLASASFAALDSKDVPPSQLPASVTVAIQKNFPTAAAVSAQKSEERNDYVYYYVTLAKGDKRTLVTITEIGEIVSAAPVK